MLIEISLRKKYDELERKSGTGYESLPVIAEKLNKFNRRESEGYTHEEAYNAALDIVERENNWFKDNPDELIWYAEYNDAKNVVSHHDSLETKEQREWLKKNEAKYYKAKDIVVDSKNAVTNQKRAGEIEEHNKRRTEAENYAENVKWEGSYMEAIGGVAYKGLVEGGWSGIVTSRISGLTRFRATSNLLMPDITKKWMEIGRQNDLQTWSNLPSYAATHFGLGVAGIDSCEIDDLKRSKEPGKSTVFVQTASGTLQPVGKIFAEMSSKESFIPCMVNEEGIPFCKLNDDGEEIYYCKDDGFCYENRDAEEPWQGNFYKITWGVTSPADQEFTPYIDENGISVKFNILLEYGDGGSLYYYQKDSLNNDAVLQLSNGESDGQTIYFYSIDQYNRACIKFNSAGRIKDMSDREDITEICAEFVEIDRGEVDFLESGREAPPITSSSEDVTVNPNI